MTTPAPLANANLQAYLVEVAAALHGPRRRRAAVIAELRDGLCAAADRHQARGLTREQAIEAATTEFGSARTLANGFSDELAAAQARHTVAVLLLTGPLVGIWWLLTLAPSSPWLDPAGVWQAIPALPFVGAAVLTGIVLIATTGRLTRWLPETAPTRALTTATVIGLVCIAIDLTAILTLTVRVFDSATQLPQTVATIAVIASMLRLAYTTFALRSHRRVRARSMPTA